jgi:hypothetical protein
VVELVLAGRVQPHEALERRRLVGGVVVDVEAGEALEALEHEVDEVLERVLLLRSVGGPEGAKPRLFALHPSDAEEVLETLVEEGVALHVEVEVSGRRRGEASEAACGLGVEQLVARAPSRALVHL